MPREALQPSLHWTGSSLGFALLMMSQLAPSTLLQLLRKVSLCSRAYFTVVRGSRKDQSNFVQGEREIDSDPESDTLGQAG